MPTIIDAPMEANVSPPIHSDTPQPSTMVVTNGNVTANCPPLLGAVAMTPPPASIVAAVHESSPSTISALTNATITADAAAASAVASPAKRPHVDLARGSVDEAFTPSPKRPNFAKPPSDDCTLLSGDDEDKWATEEACMMAVIEKQNMDEDDLADQLEDAVPYAHEWQELATSDDTDGEVGNADGVEQYETIEVTCSPKYTVSAFKEICRHVKLSTSGKKSDLFARLRDSERDLINKQSEEMFEYKRFREAEGNVPKWLILTGIETANINGIDMGTGAQHGHFGPTNKENAAGPPKLDYLTPETLTNDKGSTRIVRPSFQHKAKPLQHKAKQQKEGAMQLPIIIPMLPPLIDPPPQEPTPHDAPPPPPDTTTPTCQEPTPQDAPPPPPDTTTPTPVTPPNPKGGPSRAAYSAISDLRKARPKDFFDLMLRPKFVKECMVDTTNKRAASEGAGPGGTTYADYAPFDVQEMYKFIGLFVVNGLSPKPSMDLWFLGTNQHLIWGNDKISSAMKKHLESGKCLSGYRRWKHFRSYLALYDFRRNVVEETNNNPLWKVQTILDELNYNAKRIEDVGYRKVGLNR